MTSRHRVAGLVLLALAALTLASCAKSVNQILADPSRYRNQEVKLSGDVTESVSVGERGTYRISDHTGDLWVVSDHGVPRKGARVTVWGTIREGFNLGSLGGLINLPGGVGAGVVLVESRHKASY